ncbi:nesprin-3 [Apteryx mantelli]|uniref:Nesprin-3 n=1 Tax=Apteryx mantelli TaxID=2696672 RepID=A0ABM4EEB0_9AVES|nr:PREDICTED: nesprin-3 [Apteryx mantelli mantelli]XP_013796172.1 PREDICTED: nesprin-3 [Apteryx mantelli mantelli]XP_013796173.1 PREDICTED: nesprin-3 [Apteryx mantelli mantelli]XP_013796174.1 PREDICTED: nesprin-3 [Apteryx mantelli mantelli]XP_013796175.1 PREDICTED: nesprin-3 [Apteryx mantelli mantelli]
MTQQPQDEFDSSVENAEAWMKAIQERLRINDNTKGPRSALEARLRETEKIRELEPEGSLKMDLILVKADAALRSISEDKKHEVLSKLKDIKALWEETAIYITHCHSRIEWVWLHWSEYLKAQDEFYAWIHNMRVTLEPDIELQLGLKEKQWQLSHAQVLLNDVLNQSVLLERLLEEAVSLFNRIGDPSVDEDAQKKMRVEYEGIKEEAQSRVKLLEKITKEHERYSANINQFQLWLNGVTERLNGCIREATKSSAEDKLKALQEIAKNVRSGGKKWKHLENQCADVIQNTSPLGAERMKDELEELRKALEKLKLLCNEEQDRSLKILQSEDAYESQARQLEADVQEFRRDLQRLENDLDPGVGQKTEEEFVALWRKCNATRAFLAAEESKVERLKAQLKELLRFSQDVQPHAESVVSAIQEYQSVRGKTSKMSADTESQLRRLFQNPLQDFEQWKPSVKMLLDTPEPALAQIEAALAESSQFKEKLMTLQLKKDLLNNILGEEKAKSFLVEVAEASKEREILHKSLLQRKRKLQNLILQHKDFDAGFAPLQKKLSAIKAKVDLENEPQPDLLGKKTQLQRLQMLQDDLAELAIQMEEVEKLIRSNTTHRHEMNQLSSDSQALKRSLEMMIQQSEEHIQKHWAFNDKLSDLQQWITVTTKKLDSYQCADGEWSIESRVADLERLLAEFPDKEIQLHLVEAHGQLIMEKSSPEETAHVQAELNQLKESWRSLKDMATNLLKRWQLNRPVADKKKKIAFVDSRQKSGSAFHPADVDSSHKQERIGEWQNKNSHLKLLHDFEEWLRGENTKLTKILALESSSVEEIIARHNKLEELQSRVPNGQRLFEDLLHHVIGNSEDLEDLRYRWMLYKSKLKESLSSPTPRSLEGPDRFRKKRSGGVCAFLRRVCWAALPLQLLLLLLLLLAFLLPLAEETHSCKLANNFARSFNLMLRYEGPPPT